VHAGHTVHLTDEMKGDTITVCEHRDARQQVSGGSPSTSEFGPRRAYPRVCLRRLQSILRSPWKSRSRGW
jgi:hypothetical protein